MSIAQKICTHIRSHKKSQKVIGILLPRSDKNKSLELKEENHTSHKTYRRKKNPQMKIVNLAHTRIDKEDFIKTQRKFVIKI
jgi:hypothetical protein